MPVKVTIAPNKFDFIFPTSSLQKIQLHEMDPKDFQVAEKQFYVNVNLRKIYKL
jgi:hypothetical protein